MLSFEAKLTRPEQTQATTLLLYIRYAHTQQPMNTSLIKKNEKRFPLNCSEIIHFLQFKEKKRLHNKEIRKRKVKEKVLRKMTDNLASAPTREYKFEYV